MPRRPAVLTQADLARAARAAASCDPPQVLRVLRDGTLLFLPLAAALEASATPPAPPIPAKELLAI
jgi:hypothetical protein